MKRSSNSQPTITSRFARRKPDRLDQERRAVVASTGVPVSTRGVAGVAGVAGAAGPGLTRRRVVAGVPGAAVRSQSGRASLLESSDVRKRVYKVQKPSSTASSFSSSYRQPSQTQTQTQAAIQVAEPLPELSQEQKHIVDLVCKKRVNVFFTGEAGTGKSLIIKNIVRRFVESGITCHVTAPTGLAAVNIGGVTIYRWAGLGLMQGTVEQCVKRINNSQETKARWNETKVLVIDEVSMFPSDKFAKLDEIARRVRKKNRPFGGIQLVLTGDFFQLPPVGQSGKFLFSTNTFKEAIAHKIQLNKVFRQQGDTSLTEMLRKLRFANPCDHEDLRVFFGSLKRELDVSDGILPTVLEPRNDAVNAKNAAELAKLPGPVFTIISKDTFGRNIDLDTISEEERKAYQKPLDDLRVVRELNLKLGAQVMVVKNIYKEHMNLVNGNMGIVKWLMSSSKYFNILQSDRSKGGASRMFDALEYVEDVLKRSKPHNYYPRSRDIRAMSSECPDPNSPHLANYETAKLLLAEVYETMEVQYGPNTVNPRFECTSIDALLPVVKIVDDSVGSRFHHLSHESFGVPLKGNDPTEMLCSRQQVPLLLAWAMSIHKCQGQTLTKVRVDLSKAFCMGQAYVALSRVRSKDALQVIGFNPNSQRPSQEVIDFYRQFPQPIERRQVEVVNLDEFDEIEELFEVKAC